MPAGAGVVKWFGLAAAPKPSNEMLLVTVRNSGGAIVSENPVPFSYPKDLALPSAMVTAVANAALVDGAVDVTVTSGAFALYVTLTTLAQGRFEDNAFVMLPGTRTVKFYPFEGFVLAELKTTLRVEHT